LTLSLDTETSSALVSEVRFLIVQSQELKHLTYKQL